MKKDAFAGCHPVVNLIFFLLVVGMTMFTRNPVILGLSLLSGALYALHLSGVKACLKLFGESSFLCFGVILFNGLFNHRGMTVLFTFPGGNAFTLESMIFGFCSALLLESVLVWIHCFYRIMNMEKMIFLFGRIIPDLGLVLSMAGRLIPLYLKTIRKTAQLAELSGKGIGSGNLLVRIRNAARILSTSLTWALEHGVSTARSMKMRGYGLLGRTSYEIFSMRRRDWILLLLMLPAGAFGVFCIVSGLWYWTTFPSLMPVQTGALSLLGFGLFFVFSLMPVMLWAGEELTWNRSLPSKTIPSDTM